MGLFRWLRFARWVRASSETLPDWRNGAAYQPLLAAERTLFAWEWLRRDPLYRAAAEQGLSGAIPKTPAPPEAFGLVAFEHADLGVPEARPLWRRDACPLVLETRPSVLAAEPFEAAAYSRLASIVATERAEHLLLSDGLRQIRLDGAPLSFTGGPCPLLYSIEGLGSAEPPTLTLRRFLALCRTGRFSSSLHPPEVRARRWILMLRTNDALAAGAGQREIAQVMLSASVGAPQWRVRESSLRCQVQRLVRSSRVMAAGGYRLLLR